MSRRLTGPAFELRDVGKRYKEGDGWLTVLRGVDLALNPGEVVALVGPSGSGKSTMLHIAGLLDKPDRGEVLISGTACGELDGDQRTMLRRTAVGFVYQFHHLLPEFTAIENVMMPLRIGAVKDDVARKRAFKALDRLGLAERIGHRPAELSGGEQQRVAIARAVVNEPNILLADEPTGNLDPDTSDVVFNELIDLARTQGLSALIATHDMELASRMDRKVVMSGGRLREG
jgi:lipoprotein-releasing system ATP-binding protein